MRGVFLTILRMGLVSGYAVLVVMLVRWLLRRFPKRYSYLLWSVVLLRLVCPVGIESPFSLIPDALYVQADAMGEESTIGGGVYQAAILSARRIKGEPGTWNAGKGTDRFGEFESGAFGNNAKGTGKNPQVGQADGNLQTAPNGSGIGGTGEDSQTAPNGGGIKGTGEDSQTASNGGGIGGTGEDSQTAPNGGSIKGTGENSPKAPNGGGAGEMGGNNQTAPNGSDIGKTGGNSQMPPNGNGMGEVGGNPKEEGKTPQAVQTGSTDKISANGQQNPTGNENLPENQSGNNQTDKASRNPAFPIPAGFLLPLGGIWIAGILVFWSVWAYTALRFKKRLLGAVRVGEGVYETSQVAASFVDGIFHPVIYLATGLTGTAREYVLCHERVHIRRHDPFVKALALFLLSIYWFHPLIWLAFKKMCEDMEMSCDERVVERMGTQIKKEYSSTLLQMAQGAVGISLFAAFGGNEVKSRVRNVLSYKRPKTWLAVLLLIAVAAVGIGLGLNPGGKDAAAASGNVEGQDGLDAPKKGNGSDGENFLGEGDFGGNDGTGAENNSDGDPSGTGNSGGEDGTGETGFPEKGNSSGMDVPDKIKQKSGIKQYEYPSEFFIGDNLKMAITQLALCYGNFDPASMGSEGWQEIFVARFIQNSRASFDYLDMLSEKNDGWVDAEELYYIHYSLTGIPLDFSSYAGSSINRYDNASAFNYGSISGWESQETKDGVVVTAGFEVGYDGSDAVQMRRLTINLAKNPYSCFDGYSIVSIVSEPVDGLTEQYASILTAYHTALKEEWGKQKLSDEGFSILAAYCYGENTLEEIGYAFLDLDGDKNAELLIGATGGDDFIRQQIFELYCLKDGVPMRVLEAWERNRYYLCWEDGRYIIVNEGSSSASDGAWSCNVFMEGKLVPVKTIVYDGSTESILYADGSGREYPWAEGAIGKPVEEADAQAVIRAYEGLRVTTEYVPFSDLEALKTGAGKERGMGKKVRGKELENQLNLILNQKKTWEQPDGLVAEGTKYTVTDFNGNGRLEIIAASCQGTGHYTYADVYEVSEDGNFLVHYTHTVPEGDSQADIIWGVAPVYYSRGKQVYRYVFDDLVRNGAAYYYEGKKSLELRENQILETTLAYRITEYENGVPTVTYGGGDGLHVTDEREYEGAADQVFAGWEKGMAYFLWFTAPEQGEDARSSWYGQLETSYRSFSVVPDVSDGAAGMDGFQTDVVSDGVIGVGGSQTGVVSDGAAGMDGSQTGVASDGAAGMGGSRTVMTPERMTDFVSLGKWRISGKSLKNQLNQILSERPMWDLADTGSDSIWYAVTDLDRNGRLELLSAYYDENRGNTYCHLYEISKDGNALVPCTRTLSGEDGFQPDITSACPPLYLDLATGEICFICSDTMEDDAGHVHESQWALSFGNGHLTEQVLASREAEYNGFTKTITYHFGEFKQVAVASVQEYESAADMAFPNRVRGKLCIDWFSMREVLNAEDWYQKLEESYLGFSFSLPKQPSASEKEAKDGQAREAFLEQWKQKAIGNGCKDEAEAVAWYETFVQDGLLVESGDVLEDVCFGDFDRDGNKDCFFVMEKSVDLTSLPWNIKDAIFYGCMNGESFYKEWVSEESLIGLSVVAGDFNHDGFAELILRGDTGSNGGGGRSICRMLSYREGKFVELLLPEDWNALLRYQSGVKVSVYETAERKKCRAVLDQDGREVRFTITGSREYAPFLDEEMPGWRDGKEPFGGSGGGWAGFEVVTQDGKDYLLAKEYLLPRAGYGQIGFACLLFDWDGNGNVAVRDFYVEPF